jgi:hypothetical protein
VPTKNLIFITYIITNQKIPYENVKPDAGLCLLPLMAVLMQTDYKNKKKGLQMWFINMQNWLNQQKDGPAAPQLKAKFNKLTEIIVYATGCRSGLTIEKRTKMLATS